MDEDVFKLLLLYMAQRENEPETDPAEVIEKIQTLIEHSKDVLSQKLIDSESETCLKNLKPFF